MDPFSKRTVVDNFQEKHAASRRLDLDFTHRFCGRGILGKGEKPHVPLYIGGHWLHALAVLHKVSGEKRYLDRANAILGYYCGDNSLRARLLNELGAVNNRIIDADSDGIEDILPWDAYPESTSFVQIGLLHLLRNQTAAVSLPLARETPSTPGRE